MVMSGRQSRQITRRRCLEKKYRLVLRPLSASSTHLLEAMKYIKGVIECLTVLWTLASDWGSGFPSLCSHPTSLGLDPAPINEPSAAWPRVANPPLPLSTQTLEYLLPGTNWRHNHNRGCYHLDSALDTYPRFKLSYRTVPPNPILSPSHKPLSLAH